jgi:hypothetical protein
LKAPDQRARREMSAEHEQCGEEDPPERLPAEAAAHRQHSAHEAA